MIRKILLKILNFNLKVMLSLRYKIDVQGKELLKDPRFKGKGVLVLPNHVAEIEPFMVMRLLASDFDLKPLVTERFFYYPFAKFFMKLVRAKPVPEFDEAVNDYKFKKAEDLFNDVVEDLDNGAHILLYPSSMLKDGPKDRIAGRSLAHGVMQATENTEILLIRITGLWGSTFSTAYEKRSPDFWKVFFKGMSKVLKNLIFFTPRRKVMIEFAIPEKDFPMGGTRIEFNTGLEKFYNQFKWSDGSTREEEELTQVSFSMWSKQVPDINLSTRRPETLQDYSVPNHIRKDLLYQLSELSEKSVKKIDDHQDLLYDVGLDSLNIATLYIYLENHYDIDPSIKPRDLKTVQDLLRIATQANAEKKPNDPRESMTKKSAWPRPSKTRPEPKYPTCDTETMIETFLLQCDRMGNHSAVSDLASGVLSYAKMKQAVVILARQIEKLEGEYIGILLPSSSAAIMLILATMLAGKVPVPLNWTIGSFFIDHAIDLMEIKHIITSGRFLQKIDNVNFGKAIDKFVLVEDIKNNLTLKEKVFGAVLAKRSGRKIIERFPAFRTRGNDTACVLFTSGTTDKPKAVPLTHKNILSNQKSCVDSIDINISDVVSMALPQFHVFGLTMGLLPLFTGIRCIYSPDPLDGSTIAKEVLKWRATIIVLAPTFYSHLFRVATLSQLKTLRVCISGAERAPESLQTFIAKLGAWFVEGFGLTETSPIIAVNQIYSKARGVGKVVPSCKLAIIDSESQRKLECHQIGEICVTGDSIFKGYYKQDNTDSFVEVDGESYFKTGDLGYVDEDNYLYLEGRKKLSFKKGGEMISVHVIEKVLFDKAKEKGWIDQDVTESPFAVVPKESPTGSTKVVCFTELNLPLDQINSALLEGGLARIYKVNEVKQIDKIPKLKTGKISLKVLFDILKEDGNKSPQTR